MEPENGPHSTDVTLGCQKQVVQSKLRQAAAAASDDELHSIFYDLSLPLLLEDYLAWCWFVVLESGACWHCRVYGLSMFYVYTIISAG